LSEPTSFESIAAIDLEEITKEKMNFIVNSYINNAEWDPISCGKQLQFAETLARFVKAIHEYKEKKVVSRFSLFWANGKHTTQTKNYATSKNNYKYFFGCLKSGETNTRSYLMYDCYTC
jgi:hypothetical protein